MNIKRLAALGLRVSFTELDIRIQLPADAAELERQRQNYKALLGICLANSNCKSLLTWGLTDAYSWVPGFFNGWGAALPFDADYQPKPAYAGLAEAFADAAWILTPVRGDGGKFRAGRVDALGRRFPFTSYGAAGQAHEAHRLFERPD